MPAGLLLITPLPLPTRVTIRLCSSVGAAVNVATTFLVSSIVTTQLPVPLHAPLQPVKDDPTFGVACKVTWVFSSKAAEQARPQAIPAGSLVTVPVPVP